MQSVQEGKEKELPFVAKVFQSRTRKGKEYFVYRFNMPKEVGEELALRDGDYVFFRALPAQWYHMLEWSEMNRTYQMLPTALKERVLDAGLIRNENWHPVSISTSGVELIPQLATQTGFQTSNPYRGLIPR